MSSNRIVTNQDSLNISFLEERNKDNEMKIKEEILTNKKDIKVMTVEELDKYLDNTVSNIRIPEKQSSSFISSRFINLNLQDPIRTKFEKHILKDSDKTDKLIKDFKESSSKKKRKSDLESSDKIFIRSKGSCNNLFKSHKIPNVTSLLLSNTQFCKIQDKNDNFSRKCNKEKMVKLNEFLDDKMKENDINIIEIKNKEEESILQKENKDLKNEIVQLKELIGRKDEDLKNYKDLFSNNEKRFKEIEEKLRNEVKSLHNDIIFLKSSLDTQIEEIKSKNESLSNLLLDNKSRKDELENVNEKLKYANEILRKKQTKIDELSSVISSKLLPEIEGLKESKKSILFENDLLRKKLEHVDEKKTNIEKTLINQNTIKDIKSEMPNYMKNTKSKEKIIVSKSTEKNKANKKDNNPKEIIQKKKLNSSKSSVSIIQEQELDKKINELEETIKQINSNYYFLNCQLENCINKEEIEQLNRNMSLILSNLDKEKKKLNILLLKKREIR